MTPTTDGPAPTLASNTKPKISILLASWFGCGFLPKAPGTAGSVGGTIVSVVTIWIASFVSRQDIHVEDHYWKFGHLPSHAVVLMTVLISAVGVLVADRAAHFAGLKDPQWVVIDEVSVADELPNLHSHMDLSTFAIFTPQLVNWKYLLLGFIFFRIFDIWKPYAGAAARNAARRLGHHGGRLGGGSVRCHSAAVRATFQADRNSAMKFGFGSSTEKNGVPHIEGVTPTAAIPGGEMVIRGSGLAPRVGPRPEVYFGEAEAGLMLVTENRVIVRVPDGASDGTVRVANGNGESAPHPVSIGLQIADNLHPIGNPAVDL